MKKEKQKKENKVLPLYASVNDYAIDGYSLNAQKREGKPLPILMIVR